MTIDEIRKKADRVLPGAQVVRGKRGQVADGVSVFAEVRVLVGGEVWRIEKIDAFGHCIRRRPFARQLTVDESLVELRATVLTTIRRLRSSLGRGQVVDRCGSECPGWVLVDDEVIGPQIQRCDSCKKIEDDAAAVRVELARIALDSAKARHLRVHLEGGNGPDCGAMSLRTSAIAIDVNCPDCTARLP